MTRFFTLVVLVALSACTSPNRVAPPISVPVVPQPLPEPTPLPSVNPQSAKERFLTAAAANGCVVNASTAPTILTSATLSQDDLARVMTELKAEGTGQVASDGRGFVVTGGGCASPVVAGLI